MIRCRHATKIARFLTCSGKSAIPKANALGGDMESIDSIHPGRDASGASSRLLNPRTMSRAPTVTLMTSRTVPFDSGCHLAPWGGQQDGRPTTVWRYPSCEKASRSFSSCSFGRLVEMISKS
jgi:hypothetical protein